ncbi:tetratricopeptide repeat protein [Methanogenium marinum]|uniref:Tetratricopeptide repeat protein n=1 Tax=Methanogenium marinum TaxID=348610 RepID=A0A9Q4KUW6_9EURY|nr:tetratricopeptide repeat protein [Methanogenium marinum]MDE4907761.1 tetratricopeptide repeat protein [Methanogenium marinum]
MVTITVSEYFEEGGADEYATLRVESDAFCPDFTAVLAEIRSETQWVTVVPAGDDAISVRIAASKIRSPRVRQELEGIITSLSRREESQRRSGESVHENNRVLDHLVISLSDDGTDRADRTDRTDRKDGKDDISVVSRMMSSGAEVPKGHKWYDTAIAKNPNDAMAWNAKGEAMAAAGRTSEAKECFTLAVEIDPAYTDAKYNLNHVGGMGRVG